MTKCELGDGEGDGGNMEGCGIYDGGGSDQGSRKASEEELLEQRIIRSEVGGGVSHFEDGRTFNIKTYKMLTKLQWPFKKRE